MDTVELNHFNFSYCCIRPFLHISCMFNVFSCSNFVSSLSTFFAVVDLNGCPEEQVLNGSQPDMDDAIPCENLDDEPAQMIEELHSGINNVD